MRLKTLFFGLIFLIACSQTSQYQHNLIAMNELQKEFRKILSHCEYDNKCFERGIWIIL